MDSAWHAPRRVETTPTLDSSAIGGDQKERKKEENMFDFMNGDGRNTSFSLQNPSVHFYVPQKNREQIKRNLQLFLSFFAIVQWSNGWDFIMRKRFCPPQKDGLVWLLFCYL